MQDIIYKLENEISKYQSQEISKEHEQYVAGIQYALDVIENSVADNLIIGNIYYVIMYRNGDKYLPYIEKMKLYKVAQGSKKCSYCFTRNLEIAKYHSGTPDLVLASKRGISERIFFTEEQAEKVISQYGV